MNFDDSNSGTNFSSPLKPFGQSGTARLKKALTDIGSGHVLFFQDSSSTAVSDMREAHGGFGEIVVRRFTVGFKPQSGETAIFRAPTDFTFAKEIIAVDAAKKRIQRGKNRGAVTLLRKWMNADRESRNEQLETLRSLTKGLDENRLSDRKLFS